MKLNGPIALAEKAAALPELWSPRVLAEMNGQYLKVARVQGEFPWHAHAGEDELFLVLQGALTIGRSIEDGGSVTLQVGEAFVVPCGIRHNTSAEEETLIALFEPASTEHTGGEQTRNDPVDSGAGWICRLAADLRNAMCIPSRGKLRTFYPICRCMEYVGEIAFGVPRRLFS